MNSVKPWQRCSTRVAWMLGIAAFVGLPLTVGLAGLTETSTPDDAPQPIVNAVASIGITVSDLDKLATFYTETLGFEKVTETEASGDAIERLTGRFGVRRRTATLRLGDEFVELTEYLAPEGRPIPVDSRSNDRWFQHIAIVVSDMDKAYAHLRAHNVRHASSGPQTLPDWNPDAGGISAFYFKDPDGHVLEIIHFPVGKGDPKWQLGGERLFLGIDHTAIVVADTERSLGFYRDVLRMRVAGSSENYGTEQEHLNNVFGARLRITGLRMAKGPGVELLEYLAPTDGRDYPTDANASDLVSWTTNVRTPSVEEMNQRLGDSHTRWVSPGVVIGLGSMVEAALAVRDPDGHLIVIEQPTPPTSATSGSR